MTALAVAPTLSVAQTKMRAIRTEVSYEFIQRDEHVLAWLCAVLTKLNVLAHGDPGTGKSALNHAISARVVGAKYSWWLMDRQMDKAEMLGMMDLAYYQATSKYARVITDTLYDAHFAFFDEAEKAGPGVKTPLLTAVNERRGNDGRGWFDLPLLTATAAINTALESGDEAFADRFEVWLEFSRVSGHQARMELLQSLDNPRTTPNPTVITLDELKHAIEVEVPAVVIPDSVRLSLVTLWDELDREQIQVSDRRFKTAQRLLKAHAWLDGRSVVDEDDIEIMRHSLWDVEEHRPKVAGMVIKHMGPVTRTALTILEAVDAGTAKLDKLMLDNESIEAKAGAGARIQKELNEIKEQIARARQGAGGRNTDRLDEAEVALKELHARVLHESMGTPMAAARMTVGL